MTIEVDDYDKTILRSCPIDIDTSGRYSRVDAGRIKRIKRLWSAGYVGGTVISKSHFRINIRDAGRLAIGRPAIETPAAEATNAHSA
jgi:hypothetical protein